MMTRKFLVSFFVLFGTLAVLAACGGEEEVVALPAREFVEDCTFPDDGETDAPLWVCGAPLEGVELTAVGSHQDTQAGVAFQRQQAAATAYVELAQTFQVRVGNLVKQYVETTGTGDSETVDRVNASTTRVLTKERLVGARIYRSQKNPNTGTLFVLVGIGEERTLAALAALVQEASTTSEGDERAAWQRLQAGRSHEELAADLQNVGN